MVENCLQSDLTSVATRLGSSHLYAWMLINLTACLLVAVKGCRIRPFLVEVCCLKCILFSILVFWLTLYCLGICISVANMISRISSRLASIIRFGSLLPAVLCILYLAFVMPLFDNCDVIWTPPMAKKIYMIKRLHSMFVCKLPLSYLFKFPFIILLTERHQFHMAVQIFKSLHKFLLLI